MFDDNDLKHWKSIGEPKGWEGLTALLARLEAAEACIDDHRVSCLHDIGNPCDCGYQLRLDVWRKAAGK